MSNIPPDPPPPDWDLTSGTPTEFNDAANAAKNGYDSSNWSFKDASGTPLWLYVGKSTTTGHVAWFLREATYSGSCARGKIPQLTFDVVKNGSLNTSTGVITYNSHTYQLHLQIDSGGVQIAFAKQLT